MELLDDVQTKVRKGPIFSYITLIMPMMIYVLYYVDTSMTRDEILVNDNFMVILIVSFVIIGLSSVVFSFIRKEEPKILRFIGGAINLFFVAVIVVAIFGV